MLRAVLIDLGETLVHLDRPWEDVFGANLASLHSCLKEQGLNSDFERFANVFVSVFERASATADFYKIEIPMQDIISQALRKLKFKVLGEEMMQRAITEFYTPELDAWQPFPDTLSTLGALRDHGFEMGLVSNAKSDWAVHSILEKNGLDRYFRVVVTSAEMGIRKPRVEIFERALGMLGAKSAESAFLGDSLNADVIGARIVGMRSIHVRRRPPVNNLAHADATVSSLSEALKQVMEWSAAPLDPVSARSSL
jgi:putative hydrolase of the HAD superfamily